METRRTRRFLAITAMMGSLFTAGLMASGPASQAADPPKPITLKISDSKLGKIVTDGEGLTIYMFTPDAHNVSVCEGRCLQAWPPIMLKTGQTLADVKLEGGLRRSKLGVAMREDGSRHVTYDGWPLYYWFNDAKPGDVLGQWVGNVWFVLNENGSPSTVK
jgi:predicted lipoprotein with Yx(FWY)xxD motif